MEKRSLFKKIIINFEERNIASVSCGESEFFGRYQSDFKSRF